MMKKYSSPFLAALGAAVFALAPMMAGAQPKTYPTDVVNIAAAANGGRVLGASSTFENSAEWSANNLIDGKVYDAASNSGSLGWSSNKFDPITMDSVTLAFENGATKRIGKIVLNPTVAVAPERWAKDVEVQVSRESAEGPYRTAGILTLRREAKPQTFLLLPVDAKYVRLMFRSNQGSDRAVALGEVEIYEAISTGDPVGQLIARMEQAVAELERYKNLEIQRRNSSSLAQNEPDAPTETEVNPVLRDETFSPATLQLIQMAVRDDQTMFPVANVNIAAAKNGGKVMNYSSLFSNDQAFSPRNLLDGLVYNPKDAKKSSQGWASEGFSPGREFVTLGFGDDRSHLIGKIVLNPSSNQAVLRWARRVDVQVTNGSAKDGPWKLIRTLNLRTEPVNQEFFFSPAEAKYVRFVFQANGPADINLPGMIPGVNSDRAVSLGEIEIYEASSATSLLDAVLSQFKSILVDLKTLRSRDAIKTDAPVASSDAAQVS